MLDITLVAFGKIKEKHYEAVCQEYARRLKPYARLKIIELEPVSFSAGSRLAAQQKEAQKLKVLLGKYPDHQVVLWDEAGESFTSLTWAKKLVKINRSLLLVIGGTLGFAPEIKKSYTRWSLSPLTMPHELARVVLMEQLYRAATIIQGKEYHY